MRIYKLGHKSLQIFAFAEKTSHPRIFLLTYPEFKIMTILQGILRKYLMYV